MLDKNDADPTIPKSSIPKYCEARRRPYRFSRCVDGRGSCRFSVALSAEAPFRRKFSSIFDTLCHGEFDFDRLLQALYEYQPGESEQMEGWEVYGLDCTPNERAEAETLEDRGSLKTQKEKQVRYNHK